jgi:DNA-binding MarR family transcriptional regulator
MFTRQHLAYDRTVDERLDADELTGWVAWKRASDAVWDHVVAAIIAASGLSAADFSVLTRAVEGTQPLRQQDLVDDLGWSRSRLSRQVARMEERGLVRRTASPASTVVEATAEGRRRVAVARSAHAEAVRTALLERVGEAEREAFWRTVRVLGEQ